MKDANASDQYEKQSLLRVMAEPCSGLRTMVLVYVVAISYSFLF